MMDGAAESKMKNVVEIWKQTITVQQHFNDLALRIRSLYITVLGALFASIGFILKESIFINILGITMSASITILTICLVVIFSFWLMDLHYHRLLIAAVKHGMSIEQVYQNELPISLTTAIKNEKPVTIFKHEISSSKVINYYYIIGLAAVLIMIILFLLFLKPFPKNDYLSSSAQSINVHCIHDEKTGVSATEIKPSMLNQEQSGKPSMKK